jgi:long-subunit acyl-CoA synthetase (AMP-forming)
MSLSHGGDRTQVLYCILGGAKIGFTSGNAKNVFDDARALKPTTFYAVPRIL